MAALYTIEMWLKGMVDFNIPDSALQAIVFNNEVISGSAMIDLTEKQKDLCLADLYMWLASSSSTSSGETISDNGWSHHKAAKNIVDRIGLRNKARMLYEKWGSNKAAEVGGVTKLKDLY